MANGSANFEEQLKKRGCKLTSQRKAILDVIEKNRDKHLSTDEIHELVRKTHPEIGLATVYRTLILLDDMNIIRKLDLDDGFSRYELNKLNEVHNHPHLICLECNTVFEADEDLVDSIEDAVLKKYGFKVENHKVKLYGYCSVCLKKKIDNKKG